MAQYDGAIRIATLITTKDAEESLASLAWQIKKSAKYMDELRSKMDTLEDQRIPTKDYKDLQESLAAAEKELSGLIAEQTEWKELGITSGAAWDSLNTKIDSARNNVDSIKTKMQELVDAGKGFTLGKDTVQYKAYERQLLYEEEAVKKAKEHYQQLLKQTPEMQKQAEEEERLAQIRANAVVNNGQIVQTLEQIKQLEQEIADLKKAGTTEGYKDYDERIQKLSQLRQEVKDYNANIGQIKEKYKKLSETVKSAFGSIGNVLKKANSAVNAFGRKIREVAQNHLQVFRKEAEKAKSSVSGFAGRLKSLALSLLVFNQISVAFRKISSSISAGFKNLYDDNERFRSSIDGLKASVLTLENAFAAAFRPIVDMAVPYIEKLVEWLTHAVSLAGQFIAALSGRKTYTRAIKQTAKASEEAAGAAKEEAEAEAEKREEINKQLSPLDKLNNLSSEKADRDKDDKKDKDKDKIDAGGGIMFEEVPIENGILDMAEKFKDILSKLFAPLKEAWNREGKFVMDSWKYALEEVWKLVKDIGRDFLTVWQQDKTVKMFEDLLHIIGDIGLIIGHLARNFREAWNENETGLHILENIRDIIGVIVHNFRLAADETVKWADKLNFKPLLEAFERFTESLIPLADALSGILTDFYTQVLLPLGKWTLEKGMPELLDVFTAFNEKVDWDALRTRLSEFWDHLEPFAETVGEGLIIFIERVSDALAELINSGALDNLLTMFETLMDSITPEDVADALEVIAKALIGLKVALLGFGAISALAGVFTTIKTFFGAIASFGGLVASGAKLIVGGVGNIIAALGGILPALSLVAAAVIGWNIGEWINEKLLGVDTPSFTEMMEGIKSSFTDGSWREALHLWGEDIKSAFKEVWESAERGWNGMWDAVKRGWNQTAEWIRSAVEKIKGIVESLKESFNFWTGTVGGKLFGNGKSSSARSYSMSTPTPYAANPALAALSTTPIPALATGAVIPANKEFLALVGDQKHGTNVEAPLNTIKQALREEALSLGLIGKNETPDINLNLTVECEGYQLLNIMKKLDSEYFKQTGRHALA